MNYRKPAIVALVVIAALTAAQCKKEGPYVEIDGKKLTESDLKKDMPQQYEAMRREYNVRVLDLLKELAERKMIEAEAKEKNITPQEYISRVMGGSEIPTPAQVRERYEDLRKSGQITEPFEKIQPQLQDYMIRESRQNTMLADMTRLRKKYGFDLSRHDVNVAGEPVRNNPNGQIVVVEFSDFECPYCMRAQSTAAQLRAKYGDKLKWVFKDFPLSFHPHAMGAHIAANCVLQQDQTKYWQFFDGLFSPTRTEQTLSEAGLREQASKLGIDMTKFTACLADEKIKKEIEDDMAEGEGLGVNGTPAFFINGRMISGAVPIQDFESVIDSEL